MIHAWILYYLGRSEDDQFHFEQREGMAGFDSVDPEDWGLPSDADIVLVLQNAQFVGAWLDGARVES